MNDPRTFHSLLNVLDKKPDSRSEQELSLLLPYIKNINFLKVESNAEGMGSDEFEMFKNMDTKLSKEDYRYICEHIKL